MFVITTFNTEPEMHNNNTDCLGTGDKCKDATKSNTRKRYNSESKTQRGPSSKRNNASNTTSNNASNTTSNTKRVRNRPKKQPCDNTATTVRSVNPFLVDVTKHKNSSKKPIAIDNNVNNINNNVFLMKPTIMEQSSPRGSNSPNVFMNKSAMYSNRGLRQTDTGGGGGGVGGGVGGTSTGAPCSAAELKTMSKPCSSTSNAPGRGARGSSSRKTKPVNNRCAKTEARIARPPRPGRRGLSQLIGRRSFASAAPGRVNSGSVRRIGGSNGS